MKTWPFLIKSSVIATAVALSGGAAFAAGTANDTASNYSGGGWGTTPPNDGTGFGAWSITANANGGFSGTYLDSGSHIVTGGNSWGVYANTSTTATITLDRPFTAGTSGSTSLYNQTLSFDLASDGVGPGQGLLAADIGNAFDLQYNGAGSDNFLLSVDGGASAPVAVGFSQLNAGIIVSLAVSGDVDSATEGYALTISTFSGDTQIYSSSGTFDSSSFNTASFGLTYTGTTGNGYFNNLAVSPEVAPEPASLALFGISGLGAVLMMRRRK
ncbi:MAG TPA: PEP-CTERM sorting domain-containing protein [Verrucomicrobiae bacterium]